MKRAYAILAILILVVYGDKVFAQDTNYHPIVEDGKLWWYKYYAWDDRYSLSDPQCDIIRGDFGIKIDGDTIINEVKWSKCYLVDESDNIIFALPVSLIREENKKFFRYTKLREDYEKAKEVFLADKTIPAPYRQAVKRHCDFCFPTTREGDQEILKQYLNNFESFLIYDFNDPVNTRMFWPWSAPEAVYIQSFLQPSIIDEFDEKRNVYDINVCAEISQEQFDELLKIGMSSMWLEFYKVSDTEQNKKCVSANDYTTIKNRGLLIEGIGYNGMWSTNRCLFFEPVYETIMATGWNPILDNTPELMSVFNAAGDMILDCQNVKIENPNNVNINKSDYFRESQSYDIYGRKVDSYMPGSVYIKNGKKFIPLKN